MCRRNSRPVHPSGRSTHRRTSAVTRRTTDSTRSHRPPIPRKRKNQKLKNSLRNYQRRIKKTENPSLMLVYFPNIVRERPESRIRLIYNTGGPVKVLNRFTVFTTSMKWALPRRQRRPYLNAECLISVLRKKEDETVQTQTVIRCLPKTAVVWNVSHRNYQIQSGLCVVRT